MPNTIHNSHSQQPLSSELKQSENNIFSSLANGLVGLAQYILNNPGKAMVLGLAGQAIGSSALGKPQNQSSVGNNNLTQAFMDKPYLADSLAAIEQRIAPALNLTWLNETDVNQDERSHRAKRSLDHFLNQKICFKNVEYNEYLYAAGGHHNGNREAGKAFTWMGSGQDKDTVWRIQKDSDGTFFMYNPYHSRYLYDTNVQWDEYHPRFIVKTGHNLKEAAKWEIRESIDGQCRTME